MVATAVTDGKSSAAVSAAVTASVTAAAVVIPLLPDDAVILLLVIPARNSALLILLLQLDAAVLAAEVYRVDAAVAKRAASLLRQRLVVVDGDAAGGALDVLELEGADAAEGERLGEHGFGDGGAQLVSGVQLNRLIAGKLHVYIHVGTYDEKVFVYSHHWARCVLSPSAN